MPSTILPERSEITICSGGKVFIGNAAGLDGYQTLAAIDAAHIAEGIEHKAAAHQFQVGFQHLFAQCLQQHGGKDEI